MATRRFEVTVTATVEIDDAVFDEVNDLGKDVDLNESSWRETFYSHLRTDSDIAAHVGGNLIRGWQFDQLDGFARLPKESARLTGDWDSEAQEIQLTPPPKKTRRKR